MERIINMKKALRFIILILTVVSLIATCVSATTADDVGIRTTNVALNYAAEVITDQYSDYYTIHDVVVNVLDTTMKNGKIEYYVEINFGRKLLADEASELPYIAGSMAAKAQINAELSAAVSAVDTHVTNLITELENEYIGKIQKTSVYAYVSVPTVLNMTISLEDQCEVWIENMNGIRVEPNTISPSSAEVMYQKGQIDVNRIVSEVNSIITSGAIIHDVNTTINNNITLYDRIDARDYAREWSCTLGLTEDHETCHNPEYDFYDGDRGGDCANFVSQCLYEGGLPTDTTWYKDSATWVRGADLCDYVEDENLFFQSDDDYKAFAGSIIRWSVNNHVGLVDQNDTVTMTFCAHNKCRNSCPWAGEDVYFFIPYWDSYANDWTE